MKSLPFLGLEVRRFHIKPGQPASYRELAIWINAGGDKISWQRVQQICDRGMRKIRTALYRDKQLQTEFFHHGHK